ncbi:MAG: CheR family methyltransferase [Ignavibacteriaceae bacterium]
MDVEDSAQLCVYENQPYGRLKLTEFKKLSAEIYKLCGIQLPDSKLSLIEGRVRRRVKSLGLNSFKEYMEYFFSAGGREQELVPLIDAVTTNKTDFFRENAHFEFLVNSVLLEMQNSLNSGFSVWSAGCSTGEEPYTLAIVLNEYFENRKNNLYTIYASDISTDVLKKAKDAIYSYECIEVIPMDLKKKYFLKSKNSEKKLVRICPELRRQVIFSRINFMEDEYMIPGNLDAAFCRNVLIYFDKATQEKVLAKICNKIRTGGYLFIGHSETIIGMNLPLERAASTIYRKV